MQYENLDQALSALEQTQKEEAAYNHAMGVLYLDAATAAPAGSYVGRGGTMEILSRKMYDISTSPERGALLDYLEAHREALNPVQGRQVEVIRKDYDRSHKIPAEEYVGYRVLLNDAEAVWAKAKTENDFSTFAPYLEKIVNYNRKFAGYYNPELTPYDVLLNEYEEGMNMQTLDAFFARLRDTIVPLIGISNILPARTVAVPTAPPMQQALAPYTAASILCARLAPKSLTARPLAAFTIRRAFVAINDWWFTCSRIAVSTNWASIRGATTVITGSPGYMIVPSRKA